MITATLVLGRSEVLLHVGGGAARRGRLDARALAEVERELATLLAPAEVDDPEAHLDAERAERAAGRLLESLLSGPEMTVIRDQLVFQSGRAGREGERLGLLFDIQEPRLGRLPWELLETLRPVESVLAGCRVLRLAGCDRPRAPATNCARLTIWTWRPDEADPVCQEVERGLRARLPETLPIRWVERQEPRPGDGYRVLHIICHGHVRGLSVVLGEEGQATSADDAARRMRGLLEQVDLVVLDVCSGGRAVGLEGPAARFAAASVPVVVAPQRPLGVRAALCFSEALYRGLAAGQGLLESVEQGRQGLAGLRIAHPHYRRWCPTVRVGSASAARAAAPLGPPPLLPGWPTPEPALQPVLAGLRERAAGRLHLGVADFAFALAAHYPGSTLSYASRARLGELALGRLRLRPQPGTSAPGAPYLSPRLLELGRPLPEGFGLRLLLPRLTRALRATGLLDEAGCGDVLYDLMEDAALESDPAIEVTALDPGGLGSRIDRLLQQQQKLVALGGSWPVPQAGAGCGLLLEVIGGPEDGRYLALGPGHHRLGRWDSQAPDERSESLFVPPSPTCRQVSRRHLLLHEGGFIEPTRPTRLRRGGRWRELELGERLRLEQEDRLLLNEVLELRVVEIRAVEPR